MSFAQIIRDAEPLADGLAIDVPESWHQGRTAYGGFSSALCLAAAQKVGGTALGGGLPPLRSAQMAMMAPVNGRIEARARVDRVGRNATWVSASITGEKGLAFTASFVFMGAAVSALHLNERPIPADVTPVDAAPGIAYTRHTPAFLADNFECRHAVASAVDKQPALCRWVRLAKGEGFDSQLDPMVELLLLGDALPPGVMPLLAPGVPVSTMHWQVGLLTPMPRTQDGWWLLQTVGDYAEGGCSSQRMALWNAAGGPVMAGMQSIALFG